MARPDNAIGSTEVQDRTVVVKQCPITCGRPTRMAEKTFAKLCGHHRQNLVAWTHGHNGKNGKQTWCSLCQGEKRPAELEIIPAAEANSMEGARQKQPTNEVESMKKRAVCEGCDKDKSLSMCSGELLCSSCAALAGTVTNRPDALVKMVIKRGKAEVVLAKLAAAQGSEWLLAAIQPHLPEQVTVKLENETLERIAQLVGYTGESGEGLVDAIEQLHAANEELHRDLDAARSIAVEELENGGREQSADKWQVDWMDLFKAMDCSEDDFALAVLQTAALLEKTELQLAVVEKDAIIKAGQLRKISSALGVTDPRFDLVAAISELSQTLDRYRHQCERRSSENSVLANQLSEMEQVATNLETTATVNEQIFARLRELIDGNGLSNAELPSALEAVIVNAAHTYTLPAGALSLIDRPTASPIDSHLLDLVLEFPGIPLERIALIREAV